MKKLFSVFIVFICLFCLVGCNNNSKYTPYISQLRSDVFVGEGENYSLQIFAEQRETPFINDAVAGEKHNLLTVRVLNCSKPLKVSLYYAKEQLCADAEYNPHAMSMTATFEVSSFPTDKIEVSVEGEYTEKIECVSKRLADTISPQTALDKVLTEKKDFISSISTNGELKAEIYIRLLVENDCNFYYIGFGQGSNKITAFLLDGKTGEIIAGKD